MATFYKYKERDDISKSMIDWSGITKEISDNLMKEKERRENLKFEIEQDQNEKLKAIDEYAKGLDPTMNQAMQKYAQNYKDYLLNSHRLMRQGLVSVNDTKIKKQGAMDTFNALNEVTKTYNEKIGAFIETGGSLNDFMAKNVAGALDIRNSQIMIDDMGRGSLVTLDEDGNEVIVPVTSVNTILNKKFNRFDTTGEVLNTVKGIADWTKTFGGYRSVSDFRQRGEDFYKKTIESKVDAILNSDRKILEAASDMMNMEVTYDENLYKENPEKYILAKNQGGEITFDVDEQKVKDRLYDQIDAAIGRTEEQTPYRPSAAETSARMGKKQKEQTFRLITDALKGDRTALQALANEKTLGIVSIKKVDGGYDLLTSDGVTSFIDTSGNVRESGSTFASAVGLGGEEYKNFEKSTDIVSPKFSSNVSDVKFRTTPEKEVIVPEQLISGFDLAVETVEGNEYKQILSEAKSMARSVGIEPSRITYNPKTGKLKLDGEVIGDRSSAGTDIAVALENKGKKSILNASKRK